MKDYFLNFYFGKKGLVRGLKSMHPESLYTALHSQNFTIQHHDSQSRISLEMRFH